MTWYKPDSVRVVLRVSHMINDPSRECLAVIGSTKPLGCWQEDQAVMAEYIGMSTWQVITRLPKYQTTFWKWAVMQKDSGKVLHWESRDNRSLEIDSSSLMVNSAWNGKDTIIAIDPSVSATLREKAATALQAYIESKDKGKKLDSNKMKPENIDNMNTNSNAKDETEILAALESSLTDKGKQSASKIPAKKGTPTCKGDAYVYNIHKSPDHEKIAYQKQTQKLKKKSSKVQGGADTESEAVTARKQNKPSKIPVRVKYKKCCDCKFNDSLRNLKKSIKSLHNLEDQRVSFTQTQAQTQQSNVSDVASSILNLDTFQKSLKSYRRSSPVKDNQCKQKPRFSDTPKTEIKERTANPPQTEPRLHRPTVFDRSFVDVIRYLIVFVLALVLCKEFMVVDIQCPNTAQNECLFSLW